MGILESVGGDTIKSVLEKVAEAAYDFLMPLAEEYVKKTDNTWDDKTLAIVKAFLRDLIDDICKTDGD
jgi:hypothetical protein